MHAFGLSGGLSHLELLLSCLETTHLNKEQPLACDMEKDRLRWARRSAAGPRAWRGAAGEPRWTPTPTPPQASAGGGVLGVRTAALPLCLPPGRCPAGFCVLLLRGGRSEGRCRAAHPPSPNLCSSEKGVYQLGSQPSDAGAAPRRPMVCRLTPHLCRHVGVHASSSCCSSPASSQTHLHPRGRGHYA